MIGNTGTRATRTRTQGEPLAGWPTDHTPCIPPEHLLCSTYVGILRLTLRCGESTDVQQTSSVIPGDGLWEETRVGDVLDTVGGRLCYVYE
jgi:hypothetical protein